MAPPAARRARLLAVLFLCRLLAADPAAAAPLTLRYEVSWAGLPAGEVVLRLDEDPAGFRSQIAVRSAGLPRWFTRFRAEGMSEGGFGRAGWAEPRRYAARYDLRSRRNKRVSMLFRAAGAARVAERGPDDTTHKPQLALAARIGVVDPLTALSRMREALRRGRARAGLRIPVYDGKRRFDVVERDLVRTTRRIDGRAQPVLRLALLLVPVAGFKDNDPEGNPSTAPRGLEFVFTDDAELAPVAMSVAVGWFTMKVRLAGRCSAAAPCSLVLD